jgi:hypothetical protein
VLRQRDMARPKLDRAVDLLEGGHLDLETAKRSGASRAVCISEMLALPKRRS